MKEDYKFKISVIVPIYKVYDYLRECLESIVKQSIGFKNIELILVNDGSPDNSEEICLEYKEKYPNNVVYIKQKNSGVSASRNNGIKNIHGKYVHFVDSDDKISKNVYKNAYKILEKNKDIDSCVLRIKYFGKSTRKHYLDFRFNKGSRLVDLEKEYVMPIYSVWSLITRKEVIEKYKFDTKLKIGEDFKFVSEVIAQNPKVYLLSNSYYYYRVRENDSSVMQMATNRKDNYIELVKYCYKYVLELSKNNKRAHNYLQCTTITNMSFRIYGINLSCLTKEEAHEYIEDLRDVYKMCDDDLLYQAYVIDLRFRYRALEFKYKKPIYKDIKIKDDYIILNNKNVLKLNDLNVNVDVFQINKNVLNINACFDLFLNNDYDLYAKINDKYIRFKKFNKREPLNNIYSKDYEYYKTYFDIDIDLKDVKNIEFYIKINNKYYQVKLTFENYSKLNNLPHSYYTRNGYTLTYSKKTIYVNKKIHFKFLKYLKDILFVKKDLLVFGILLLYKITYPFQKHNNWILSDRYDVAGDNGEFLFKYLRKNLKKKNIYFGLKKKSKDINKMKKVGKLLYFNTLKYFIKYFNSEMVASSHIDDFIRSPFGRRSIYLNSFMNYKFVFLQHGVTKNDMSNWLCKSNKNIDILVCSSNIEYDEFLREDYMYDKSIVKLTGMPRYDNLLNNDLESENLIAFMPTWRTTLCGPKIAMTQNRAYNDKFKESEYYKFYNGLVTDKKFVECLKRNNCRVLFCLHPAFVNQLKDFENTDYVKFKTEVFYPDVFKKAKLMLTDYSSVAFDFGYTKKPLIYSHFDKDYLYQIHTVLTDDSEFSYEKDGFGKVTYNYNDTLNELIKIIDNGFKNDKKYMNRVDKFFKYKDDNCCKRVYDSIEEMLKNK